MDDRTVITIIKNGEEKVITFNKLELLNPNKKLGNIFKNQEKRNRNMYYIIDDSVEYIHIKNFVFNNSFELKGNRSKDVILILENCTFCDYSSFLDLFGVELLLPKFKKDSSFSFDGIDDVNVVLDSDNDEFDVDIGAKFVNYFTLESASYLKALYLNFVGKTILNNFNSLVRFSHNYPFGHDSLVSSVIFLNSEFYDNYKLKVDGRTKLNMKLINSSINLDSSDYFSFVTRIENLELVNSNISSCNFLDFVMLKRLILNNSSIKCVGSMLMNIIDEIRFCDTDDTILDTSSYLEVGKKLKLKDNEFYGSLIFDSKYIEREILFKRQSLINVLKKYKEKILEENERKVNELEDRYQNMIDSLIEEKEVKKREYVYVLENKKIKEL